MVDKDALRDCCKDLFHSETVSIRLQMSRQKLLSYPAHRRENVGNR